METDFFNIANSFLSPCGEQKLLIHSLSPTPFPVKINVLMLKEIPFPSSHIYGSKEKQTATAHRKVHSCCLYE